MSTLSVRAQRTVGSFELDVAFEAPPGVTVLFGPSGAGKSSTLSIIAGLRRPDAGRIALGDEVWLDRARGIDRPAHSRGVGYLFQSLALFPHLRAVDNVAYGLDRTLPAARRDEIARGWLARMKVEHVAERFPGTLSGGEAQRVALARALGRTTAREGVVLLDEAFHALDAELRHALGTEVVAIVESLGVPAIVVTHEREDAHRLGHRAVVLRDGRVVASGSIAEALPS